MIREETPIIESLFQQDQLIENEDQKNSGKNRVFPGNLAVKCPKCKELLYAKDWEKNLKVCSRCEYHFRISAIERINMLLDAGTFQELDRNITSVDPLQFVSKSQSYAVKLRQEQEQTGLPEAITTGYGQIEQLPVSIAVMDFQFIGGSMGSVVGEKVARAVEYAIDHSCPFISVSASGGARMHEGLFSLMQMAKTSAALRMLGSAGFPFISILTDPTTGGVTASFAMLGDINLAEPGALIGFAGPRVIEQFMHQKLPADTDTSEFVLEHGMIDAIVHRKSMRAVLAKLIKFYGSVPELHKEKDVDMEAR